MLCTYPARFHKEAVGGYSVDFPDLPGCVTEGDDAREAKRMAADALKGYLASVISRGLPVVPPSKPSAVDSAEGGFAVLISVKVELPEGRRAL